MLTARAVISPHHRGEFFTLLVLCAGMFMAILDVNVINIAIVGLQHQFNATTSSITWAVDAYNLALTGFMLCGGKLADMLGGRRIWLLGIGVFTCASLACGLSLSIHQLILWRLVQGVGAALFIPASFSLMPIIWPDTAAKQKAVGLFGGIVAIAAATGPIIGGGLMTYFSWRSVFLINIPIGVSALWAAGKLLPSAHGQVFAGADIFGQALGIAALAGISYLLIELPALDWRRAHTQLIALLSLCAGAGFIIVERYGRHPAIPLSLFNHPAFTCANVSGLLINACYFGVIYALSLFFQQTLHFSPWQTGVALLPLALCLMIGNMLAGRTMAHYGVKKQMVAGLVTAGVGYAGMLCLHFHITFWVIFFMALLAGGTAFVVPPMTVTVLRSAPVSKSGVASGVHTTLRQMGSLLGIALAGLALSLTPAPLEGMMLMSSLIHFALAGMVWRWLGE